MFIYWMWDFEEAHPRTQFIRGEKLQLNRNNYLSLATAAFPLFSLLSFASCHHQKQLVFHVLAQPLPFPSHTSGLVCSPPPSLPLQMMAVGWSNKEGFLLSWVLAHIIFMPGHLCANYLMAAHILVNSNLDNLKKIIPGYRCYLFCWMAIKNNREENCCQSGLLCAKNEFLLMA